jgi:hypothetical protein
MTRRKRRIQSPPVAEADRGDVNGVASRASDLPDATRERLAELNGLEADWDSYGALRVSPEALAAAGAIISQVIARAGDRGVPRDIMPIADGGVALEWRSPRLELALNACPEGGWSSLLIERGEGGWSARRRPDRDDALAGLRRRSARRSRCRRPAPRHPSAFHP